MALKESIRKLVLEKRDAIPADQRVKKSQRICDQLTQIALQHVGESSNASRNGLFIAAYEPMRNEVDVHPFFREAFARGWHVCLPCMAKDAESAKARMVFFELSETRIFDERPAFLDHPARPFLLADLHAQGWHEIDEVLFDIAVIPMVAFDSTLMRLGYGGGNYDRFLPKLRPDCLVTGVAFAEQQIPVVPTGPHDLSLPRIISA